MAEEPTPPSLTERERLQTRLEVLTTNAYFQPPPNHEMQYPCIRWKWDPAKTTFADNKPYLFAQAYQLTVIFSDPDDPLRGEVAMLPSCKHDRDYVADKLYHSVFTIYF